MLKPLYGNKIVRKMAYLPYLCCLAIFVNRHGFQVKKQS